MSQQKCHKTREGHVSNFPTIQVNVTRRKIIEDCSSFVNDSLFAQLLFRKSCFTKEGRHPVQIPGLPTNNFVSQLFDYRERNSLVEHARKVSPSKKPRVNKLDGFLFNVNCEEQTIKWRHAYLLTMCNNFFIC